MRRLLVDHARKHNAEKRGQDFQKLSLDENIDRAVERSAELIALDDALKTLATFDAQKARMVELRYFGGLSIEETADVLRHSHNHQTSLAVCQSLASWGNAKKC